MNHEAVHLDDNRTQTTLHCVQRARERRRCVLSGRTASVTRGPALKANNHEKAKTRLATNQHTLDSSVQDSAGERSEFQ